MPWKKVYSYDFLFFFSLNIVFHFQKFLAKINSFWAKTMIGLSKILLTAKSELVGIVNRICLFLFYFVCYVFVFLCCYVLNQLIEWKRSSSCPRKTRNQLPDTIGVWTQNLITEMFFLQINHNVSQSKCETNSFECFVYRCSNTTNYYITISWAILLFL